MQQIYEIMAVLSSINSYLGNSQQPFSITPDNTKKYNVGVYYYVPWPDKSGNIVKVSLHQIIAPDGDAKFIAFSLTLEEAIVVLNDLLHTLQHQ